MGTRENAWGTLSRKRPHTPRKALKLRVFLEQSSETIAR